MTPWKKTVYASWAAQVLSIAGFTCVLPFLPFYIRELGVSGEANVRIWAGYVNSASGITLVLFGPVWGILADRFGRKPMVLRSMFGGAVILTLMAFCQNVHHLLICRFIQGMLTGTVTASIALVASAAPRHKAGFALGMMGSAVYVGASVGPLMGGVLWDYVHPRAAFFVAGALLLAGGLLVKYVVHEDFKPVGGTGPGEQGSFAQVFAAAGFLAVVFAYFTIRFAYGVSTPVFPLFVEQLSVSKTQIRTVTGLIVSVGGVSAAVAAAVFGRFSDAWGHRRMLLGSSLFAAVVAAAHAAAVTVAHLFALRILFGLAMGMMIPAINAIIRRGTHDKNLGKAYGVATSLTFAGYVVGPVAGGYLSATLGLRSPFVLMGLAFVVAAVLARWRVPLDGPDGASAPEESEG